MGLSIKIIMFRGKAAGWLKKGATGDFFFHFCKKKKKYTIFSYQEKKSGGKKKKSAARLASVLATRWTGNRYFFMESLGMNLQNAFPHDH